MNSVPFRMPSIYGDLGECNGILTHEDDFIEFEYQAKDSILGIVKSRVKEKKIRLEDLVEIKFQSGWFSRKIIIRAARMRTFSDIPGNEQGVLQLTIAKKDKETAKRLVDDIELRIAEMALNRLDEKDR